MNRTTAWALGIVAIAAFAFVHFRPLLVWHFDLKARVAESPHLDRLTVDVVDQFPPSRSEWRVLRTGGMSVRAPIQQNEAEVCRACAQSCLLQVAGGTLAILPETVPASYSEALDGFAPDVADLSPWRWPWENWRTLDAISRRALNPTPPPQVFRYEAVGSHGIVTHHEGASGTRFVVYAYSPDGASDRILGITGVGRREAKRILGSLKIEDPADAPDCDSVPDVGVE